MKSFQLLSEEFSTTEQEKIPIKEPADVTRQCFNDWINIPNDVEIIEISTEKGICHVIRDAEINMELDEADTDVILMYLTIVTAHKRKEMMQNKHTSRKV